MLNPGPDSYKASAPRPRLPTLPSHEMLAVEGPDAAAFLQAQLMNDVRLLVPGRWQWNGWLSAKGRLIALMALLRTAEDRFLLVLPDMPAAELQSRLQRFVFRSKVRLSALTDWHCAVEFEPAVETPADRELAQGDDQVGWRLDMGGDDARRALWLLPAASPATAPPESATSERWLALDLAHGLPRLPGAGVEAWTPQMLSLDRLHAFSLTKGCYPGQEIVARTHYLGKAKRALLRISGAGLRIGDAVTDAAGVDIGQIACVRTDGGEALAVAALERIGESLSVAGEPVVRLPLADGLARPV